MAPVRMAAAAEAMSMSRRADIHLSIAAEYGR
jgi:hypothetical protein